MERIGLMWLFTALLFAVCLPSAARLNQEPPAQASICQLTHFGPDQDGHVYTTAALYSTDLRHGAWLIDPTNTNCWIALGAPQSDIDGSIARFEQALVDGIMRNGPGTKRALYAELVFHWVKTGPGSVSLTKSWVPKGMVELRRVFSSSPASEPPNQSSKRTREKPRAA